MLYIYIYIYIYPQISLHIFPFVCFLIYGIIWGTPQAAAGGTLEGHGQSQPIKILYKNLLEIPKGIPS